MSDEPAPDRTTAKFLRGLTIGALLGAVVAGSSIWSRRGSTRRRAGEASAPMPPHRTTSTTPDPTRRP